MHTHTHYVLQKQRRTLLFETLPFVTSVSLRNLKTHYENVNLQKDQKGRHELLIPRYHELVPKEAEKKVSVEYWVCVLVVVHSIIMTSTLLIVFFSFTEK